MKRSLILIVTIFVTLIVLGCESNNTNLNNNDKRNLKNNDHMNYQVEKIVLSKSFQSIDPSIEVETKKDSIEIVASLGLTESSGVKINKIVRKGKEVNIHISSIYEEDNLQLAVPQVILEIETPRFAKFNDLKFNIVKDDFEPVEIKIGINEALSKVNSHFKLSPSGTPSVDLFRSDEDIIWNISYNSIFDKDNPQTPLINLSTSIDANTGEIIDSDKTLISSTLDDGHVLDYISNNNLLYKKTIEDNSNEDIKEQLWTYNLSTSEKNMVFSSNSKIDSAEYSKDLSYISLIEKTDKGTEVYIIPRKDEKAYKISFEDIFNPEIMSWKDDNNLYLVENQENNSIISSQNISENSTTSVANINKEIVDLIIKDNVFLIVENSEDEYNKEISKTSDWKNFDFIDHGFSPEFLGENNLGYLKKNEKLNTNSMVIYNFDNQEIIDMIDGNISTFQNLSNENIAYVKKNPAYNNFSLIIYSLENKKSNDIGSLIGDNLYYDTEREVVYANIDLPFENYNQEMIFSIDLNRLN